MAHHHSHHDQHGTGPSETALAELLDLEAEALQPYLSGVIDWTAGLVTGPPREILDLGSGTGVGALALARRFEAAEVIAVDISAPMLDRLQTRARELGVAGRVRTLQADLDAGWPATGPVDLVWASSSLHHVKDPDQRPGRGLRRTAPRRPAGRGRDGLLPALPARPDPGAGLEAALPTLLDEVRASEMPHLGSDWGPRLSTAGFAIQAERTFTIDQAPAARRGRPLRAGFPGPPPVQPGGQDQRRRPGHARHAARRRRARQPAAA